MAVEKFGVPWRELCAAAAREDDPEKLVVLVKQIVNALDEQRRPVAGPGQTTLAPSL